MTIDTASPVTPRAGTAPRAQPQPWLLWGMSIVVAALGSWLLYDELPGINWTLWTLSASAGFVFCARARARAVGVERATLLTLACALAAGAAMTGMPLLQALIALCIMVLAALVVISSQEPLARRSVPKLAATPLVATAEIIAECWHRTSEAATTLHAERSLAVVRGSLLAAPIVLVFFLLLSGADPTLADWRTAAVSTLSSLEFVPQMLFFIVLGIAALGAYGIAARYPTQSADVIDRAEPRASVLADTERLIVLGSVAALFALFLVLQLSYLFGNAGGRAGSGVTFAAAAHRGFIELTLTAALSAVLIIALDRFAKRGDRENLVKYGALVLIAESIPMLLSANSRITHYEAAYGYTLLRLYVHVYIAVVCIAMILLARQTLRSIDFSQLLRQLAMTAMVALAVMAFWNHAAWIVDKNVGRYAALGQLDANYLRSLTTEMPDGVPQLVASLPQLAPGDALVLRQHLLQQRGSYGEQQPRWYAWHLRRAQANDALQRLAKSSL
jgi:hypothetical protein